MLKNSRGEKWKSVVVDQSLWHSLTQQTFDGLKEKLSELKTMVGVYLDEYICTAQYTFVIEEFGKVLLLAKCPLVGKNKREIKYSSEFADHDAKFSAALDYLQANGFEDAYVLNDEGSFNPKSFSWRRFTIGQLVDVETRFTLLYSDLDEDKQSGSIIISQTPNIDRTFLKRAVTTFDIAVNAFKLPFQL